MLLRLFSSLLFTLLVCGTASARTAHVGGSGVQTPHVEKPPRNIIVIIVDDVGSENIDVSDDEGTAGLTPVIDALADEGVRYTNFWANPNCSPFRSSALTGLYTQAHGVGQPVDISAPISAVRANGLRVETNNLARILAKRGYRTEHFGKYHMGGFGNFDDPRLHANAMGFQNTAGSMSGIANDVDGYGDGTYVSWEKCTNGTCAKETTYATTDTTDDAVAALSGAEPFFLWVAYNAPHKPVHVPTGGLLFDATVCDDLGVDGNLACYKAAMEAVDTEMGRLLGYVDKNDTAVIFVSDNGTPADVSLVESPRTIDNVKTSVHRWGIQTTFIIAGNVVPAARHSDVNTALAGATDIYQTVLAFAGIDIPTNVVATSVSLVPTINSGSAEVRDIVFVEQFYPNGGPPDITIDWWERAIECSASHASCDKPYKLSQNLTDGTEAFYDKHADADPDEATDLLPYSGMTTPQKTAYDFLSVLILTEGLR